MVKTPSVLFLLQNMKPFKAATHPPSPSPFRYRALAQSCLFPASQSEACEHLWAGTGAVFCSAETHRVVPRGASIQMQIHQTSDTSIPRHLG